MATSKLDTLAHLRRAHDALGKLIASQTDHAWAAFYDALQYVPGVEDAASDAFQDQLHEMWLSEDGTPLDADGEPLDDWNVFDSDCYTPMSPIYMPQVAA